MNTAKRKDCAYQIYINSSPQILPFLKTGKALTNQEGTKIFLAAPKMVSFCTAGSREKGHHFCFTSYFVTAVWKNKLTCDNQKYPDCQYHIQFE